MAVVKHIFHKFEGFVMLISSTSRQQNPVNYFQTYHDLSHLSEKRSPKNILQHLKTLGISCVTPIPNYFLWSFTKKRAPLNLHFSGVIPSHPDRVALYPPPTGALLIIISCESPDWVSDADLPGVSLSAGDTRTLLEKLKRTKMA